MENATFSHQVINYLSTLNGPVAYGTIFAVLFACGLGLPVPEDITLITAGVLSSAGSISLPGALIVGYFGVLIGDSILFFAGRKYGRNVFKLPLFRRVFTPDRIQLAEARIQRNAKMICFMARFLPGLRAPIFLTAGVMKVRPSIFILQDGLAAIISVPIWIFVGHWFGENIDPAIKIAKRLQLGLFIALVLVVGIYFLRRRGQKKVAPHQRPQI